MLAPSAITKRARLVNLMKVVSVLVVSLLIGCSSIPFMGDDEDDDEDGKPAAKKKEKIKTELVYISKGELQCEDDTGDPIKATKARLEASGIRVYSSDCAKITGLMHPSLCGSTTLDINIHEINVDNYPQAEKLGFTWVESLEEKDLGYETYGCDL